MEHVILKYASSRDEDPNKSPACWTAFTLWAFPPIAVGKNLTACLIFEITACDRLWAVCPRPLSPTASHTMASDEFLLAAALVALNDDLGLVRWTRCRWMLYSICSTVS